MSWYPVVMMSGISAILEVTRRSGAWQAMPPIGQRVFVAEVIAGVLIATMMLLWEVA